MVIDEKLFLGSGNAVVEKFEDVTVIDNFYADPLAVRAFALEQTFKENFAVYKSSRTSNILLSVPGLKELFESFMDEPIIKWDVGENISGGCFQFITESANPCIHVDVGLGLKWGSILFLTPEAPVEKGIGFYHHKQFGFEHEPGEKEIQHLLDTVGAEKAKRIRDASIWREGETPGWHYWDLKYDIENKFNRLVIFPGNRFHSSKGGFGNTLENARLLQTSHFR